MWYGIRNIFQLNTVTHYLDLSLVYGSNNEVAASLRAGFDGRLNVELKHNREFPPSVPNKTATCDTVYEFEPCYATGKNKHAFNRYAFLHNSPFVSVMCLISKKIVCSWKATQFFLGDIRANQNPQLTILHIMLLREHNRIADYLARLNPHWTDETTFQETRRIVIAEHQNIVYYEWLPIFLGSNVSIFPRVVNIFRILITKLNKSLIINVINVNKLCLF